MYQCQCKSGRVVSVGCDANESICIHPDDMDEIRHFLTGAIDFRNRRYAIYDQSGNIVPGITVDEKGMWYFDKKLRPASLPKEG